MKRFACLAMAIVGFGFSIEPSAAERKWSAELLVGGVLTTGDTAQSWLNGGMGKFRFDNNDDADFNIDHLAIGLRYKPNLQTSLVVDFFHHPDPDGEAALSQAFLQYKPLRSKHWRSRYRIGIFHAPFSLENRGKFWAPSYTATPSAINSWLGEELRTVGAEGIWTWSKTPRARDKLSIIGALFGANDPAGSMLSWRGWSSHNRQTGFGEKLPLRWLPAFDPGAVFENQARNFEPFKEVDNRVGAYTGFEWRRHKTLKLQTTVYHNNGDPNTIQNGQYTWRTQFVQLALHLRLRNNWEILSQVMDGRTVMGDHMVDNDFDAAYVMLAKTQRDKHRWAVRAERYNVDDKDAVGWQDPNDESGWAATVAYTFSPNKHWRLSADYNHNKWSRASYMPNNPARIRWTEKQLLLGAQYFFDF